MCVLPCRIPPRLPTNPALFSREGAREPESWSTLSHTVHSGDYSVKHHRGLGVYLLTAEAREGTAATWERDIQHLQMHMQSHQHQVSKGLRGWKRKQIWLVAAWHLGRTFTHQQPSGCISLSVFSGFIIKQPGRHLSICFVFEHGEI